MGEGFHFLDIILIAMVAGFIILRLRSVLGRRTGHEPPPSPAAPLPGKRDEENVVALPDRRRRDEAEAVSAVDSSVPPGVARIRAADRSFSTTDFTAGAKAAYEIIVNAFAAGDSGVLRPLLSPDVFASFNHSIDDRKARNERQETTLVAINKAEILEADMKGQMAEVTIKFVAELINTTRDHDGNIIAGNPNAAEEVTDIWTFSRDTRSGDPNWVLIGTSTSN